MTYGFVDFDLWLGCLVLSTAAPIGAVAGLVGFGVGVGASSLVSRVASPLASNVVGGVAGGAAADAAAQGTDATKNQMDRVIEILKKGSSTDAPIPENVNIEFIK